jgi:hypothetical protein
MNNRPQELLTHNAPQCKAKSQVSPSVTCEVEPHDLETQPTNPEEDRNAETVLTAENANDYSQEFADAKMPTTSAKTDINEVQASAQKVESPLSKY